MSIKHLPISVTPASRKSLLACDFIAHPSAGFNLRSMQILLEGWIIVQFNNGLIGDADHTPMVPHAPMCPCCSGCGGSRKKEWNRDKEEKK